MYKNPSAKDEQAAAQALQFGEALWQLPLQYINVFVRPSVNTLSDAMENASWGRVLVQCLHLVIVMVTISFLGSIIPSAALHSISALSMNAASARGWPSFLLNDPTLLVVSFLIGLGTAYWGSRVCGGQGTFLSHLYCLLLCTIPLVTVGGVLLLLPTPGWFLLLPAGIVSALFIYRMVLHTITIMAVHRLEVGQAVFIMLILPIALLVILVLVALLTHGEGWGDLCDSFLHGGGVGEGKRRKKERTAQ
ncbi:MAG: YIP1 family protein [Ktedonobacteraceae bacterium]|nr:YIP1 family protein [Ktedonobacteraceae bacterium]